MNFLGNKNNNKLLFYLYFQYIFQFLFIAIFILDTFCFQTHIGRFRC